MPGEIDLHIGKRLKYRRRQLDLSQAEIADRVGVRFQQVAKYETGANRISASRLFLICKCLGVDPIWFFEGIAS